ncbi:MAG TPA: MotA/TolQ/ExbB proton channel family protein [Balneolaceae bacterium]
MLDLFYAGGLFMPILTLLLLIILAMASYRGIQIVKGNIDFATTFRHQLTQIKSMGLFSLVFGILGQFLGLYQMLSYVESAGDIAPYLIYGGLKVTMISTLYGMIIFLISYIVWLGLDYMLEGKKEMS